MSTDTPVQMIIRLELATSYISLLRDQMQAEDPLMSLLAKPRLEKSKSITTTKSYLGDTCQPKPTFCHLFTKKDWHE